MSEANPPHQLVLGSAAYDKLVSTLEARIASVRAHESASRGADFPVTTSCPNPNDEDCSGPDLGSSTRRA